MLFLEVYLACSVSRLLLRYVKHSVITMVHMYHTRYAHHISLFLQKIVVVGAARRFAELFLRFGAKEDGKTFFFFFQVGVKIHRCALEKTPVRPTIFVLLVLLINRTQR